MNAASKATHSRVRAIAAALTDAQLLEIAATLGIRENKSAPEIKTDLTIRRWLIDALNARPPSPA